MLTKGSYKGVDKLTGYLYIFASKMYLVVKINTCIIFVVRDMKEDKITACVRTNY